jgi:hypothetical protein
MVMKKIYIADFPKFEEEFVHDEYDKSMKASGFKSAIVTYNYRYGYEIHLSDEDYTWFILRWL